MMKKVTCRVLCAMASLFCALASSQSYTAPAGDRPALRREGASILPGGRILAPFGKEYATGPGPFAIALSPSGRSAATANAGPWRYTVTVFQHDRAGNWDTREIESRAPVNSDGFGFPGSGSGAWRGISNGIAFSGERSIWVSEGNSGRVALYDSSEEPRRTINLNTGAYGDSYTGALAYDDQRGILYISDQANFRVAVADAKTRQILTSVRVGPLPFALALSPDRQKLYVASIGVFQYRMVPNANAGNARSAGLDFPPPPPAGADDPEAQSLAVIDVSTPESAKLEGFVRIEGSPSAVVSTKDRVYVSCADADSITVIDPASRRITGRIPIRIPGLDSLRGVIPLGMAYDQSSGWLLVAEAGINAVAVIDTRQAKVLGHIPAGWYPTSIAISGDEALVASARGHGIGPDAPVAYMPRNGFSPSYLFQGAVSIFHIPAIEDLAAFTDTVMRSNGFTPQRPAMPPSPPVRHVVLIVKEGRTYDEILGDIPRAKNGIAVGNAEIARYGLNGTVEGGHQRLSLKGARVTPNAHAIAEQWAFSDNFYSDADGTVDGHHWLNGVYPNAWTESSLFAAYGNLKEFAMSGAPGRLSFPGMASSVLPEDHPDGPSLWSHLADHGVSFYNFGEGLDLPGAVRQNGMGPLGVRFLTDMPMPAALRDKTSREYPGYNLSISDQDRAAAFIREVDEKFVKSGADVPQFIYIYLPGDAAGAMNPDDNHPYKESFVADNDLAVGRIVEYLSASKWWKDTAVFVTESTGVGGIDHVSANRTLLLAAGPWIKQGYVSHTNVSFPGLLKTVFWILGVPPLNLFDASAADLRDCFAASPTEAQYHALPADPRLFVR